MGPTSVQPAIKPGLGLIVSVVSASTAAILIRLSSADPLAVAALRLGFAALLLAPIAGYMGLKDLALLSRKEKAALFLIGSCLAAHFALWITSLYLTTVAASVLLVSTSPVFVALFGQLFMGDRVTRSVCMGIGLAMAGVAVMVLPGGELSGSIMGMIMALGGAVAVAGYLLGGRRLRQKLSLISYVFCVYATAAIILTALCAVLGVKLLGLPGKDYMLFFLLGIVPSHLGHTLYNYLLRFLDAKVIAVSTLGEPIFSSLLALAILNEIPHPAIIAGAPPVFLGIYLTVTRT